MTRTRKVNSPDYQAIADGQPRQEHIPKFFGKSGFSHQDPKKTKKNGGGRANWGNMGDEVMDEGFNFAKARRRSNSSSVSTQLKDFKTKFDVNEPEPVFEDHYAEEDEDLEDYEKPEPSESGNSSN